MTEQWSMADIAKHFACSVQTIWNLICKTGIQPRLSSCPSHKRSQSKAGVKNPMFGIKRPEHAKFMSELRKGMVFSDVTRQRMSDAKNGKWGGEFIGLSHPKWLPPEQRKAPLYKQIRDCSKMWSWRTTVFKRDDFTCQICRRRGGTLNADHIKQFALILKENGIKTLEEAVICEELWNLENGRTLCELCHRKTDTFARRIK